MSQMSMLNYFFLKESWTPHFLDDFCWIEKTYDGNLTMNYKREVIFFDPLDHYLVKSKFKTSLQGILYETVLSSCCITRFFLPATYKQHEAEILQVNGTTCKQQPIWSNQTRKEKGKNWDYNDHTSKVYISFIRIA